MIPTKTPTKNNEFDEHNIDMLVELSDGFSGREIKNAVLNGIIASVTNKDYFSIDDAKASFENEKKTHSDTQSKQLNTTDQLSKKIRKALRIKKVKRYSKSGKHTFNQPNKPYN